MTAKFDAFKAALDALCIEHGVHLSDGDEYDYQRVSVAEATDEKPAGIHMSIEDDIPLTAEERAAQVEGMRLWRERDALRQAEWRAEHERQQAEILASPTYKTWLEQAQAEAKQQRNEQMRVSTDPKDPAFLDDRPRRAWCNDVEIEGWTVADEFRRCVVTPTKVHNGSVRIERLPDDYVPNFTVSPPEPPIDSGFTVMFVSDKPAATPAPTPAPAAKKTRAKRRR